MQPFAEALLALVLMVVGSGIGTALRRGLPHHLDEHAKDVVRLGAALVATITALVLGLMISSANGFFDAQRAELRKIAADWLLLDTMLDNYGPAARGARLILRQSRASLVDQLWGGKEPPVGASPLGENAHALFNAIVALPVTTPLQHALQDRALSTAFQIAQTRLTLFEWSRARLPEPILYLIMFWQMALFASFSLFTPLNPMSFCSLVLVAICAAGALFLILDMQQPFSGLMRLSPNALTVGFPPLPP